MFEWGGIACRRVWIQHLSPLPPTFIGMYAQSFFSSTPPHKSTWSCEENTHLWNVRRFVVHPREVLEILRGYGPAFDAELMLQLPHGRTLYTNLGTTGIQLGLAVQGMATARVGPHVREGDLGGCLDHAKEKRWAGCSTIDDTIMNIGARGLAKAGEQMVPSTHGHFCWQNSPGWIKGIRCMRWCGSVPRHQGHRMHVMVS